MELCIHIALLLLLSLWIASGAQWPPSTGLYFQLGNTTYLPGQSINISDIGEQPNIRSDPGFTLICVSVNVNKQCCRKRDGGIGEWYYPNGTQVPRPNMYYEHSGSFSRYVYIHQVRLGLIPGRSLGPFGTYKCEVPDGSGSIVTASIVLTGSYVNFNASQDVVEVGDQVSFTCSVEAAVIAGNNITILFTTPANEVITTSSPGFTVNSRSNTVRVITISSVLLSQAGVYVCEVTGANVPIRAVKLLHVKLPAPLLVSVFPPLQPVYATSTRNVTFHIQLKHKLNISVNFTIQWTSPVMSIQHLPIIQVNATGKKSYENSVSLPFLSVLDSGNYTCSVSLYSSNPYIVESDASEGSAVLTVQNVPTIEVTILSFSEPFLGDAYILLCSHRSVEPNFIYTNSFEWCHNGGVLGEKSRVLVLSSLSYSSAGNYTCKVNATSAALGSSISATSIPHVITLSAPSPTLINLIISSNLVFAGTAAYLTCSAIYAWRIDANLTVTMDFSGPVGVTTKQAVMKSSTNFTSTYCIPEARQDHVGKYNCSVVSSGPYLIPSPSTTSNSVDLAVVGAPSAPRVIAKIPFATSVYFTWSVNQEEIVEYSELYYSYDIQGCHGLGSNGRINIEKTAQSYNLTGLEENSDVVVTLTAINTAGRSLPATFRTATLKAALTRGPANLRATSTTHSSISVSWEPVPCADRNTDITGYTLTYSTLNTTYHQNFSINEQTYNATELIPATRYRVDVVPNHDAHDQVAVHTSIEANTSTVGDLKFFLGGSLLPNNSIVKPGTIGIGGHGLFCLTNTYNCCRPPFSIVDKGDWLFTNQSIISSPFDGVILFSSSRHSSSIILHHMNLPNAATGIFTCRIPDLNEDNKILFIHIADNYSDLVIKVFRYRHDTNKLSCISSGRPVNSYRWLKDGRIIDKHNLDFHQTQILQDSYSATYEQHLFAKNRTNFEGRFTCLVTDIYGNSDSRTLMLNNCPAGQYGAVAFDGSTVCIACPANSMSTSEGSNKCGCLQGYYRNDLEDHNFPCTRPPSKCRNLRVKELIPGSSAVLQWTRPVITGRQDLYYNIHLSDPDNLGSFLKKNLEPVVSDASHVEYTLSGLQPLTVYEARVFSHNGVSEKDKSNHYDRMCDVSWTTSSEKIGVPHSVSAVCGMVAWKVPVMTDEKILTGYDIIFASNTTSDTVLVSKKSDENFHVIREKDWPDQDQKYQAFVKVRVRTATSTGAWSDSLSLDCASKY